MFRLRRALRGNAMGTSTTVELFRNADWSVRADGLEHGNGYFIARGALAARRAERLWDWPLQMAEKRWCRPSLFREAFLVALDRFGIERDADLTRSFALGYGIRAADAPTADGMVPLADLLRPREAPVPAPRPARALVAAGA
jgi:hypothetical protein